MRLGLLFTAFVLVMSSVTTVQAQQALVERSYSGTIKEQNPQIARRKLQEEANLKVSEEIIQELIGAERFVKNKSLIKNKIIKNSARYIPYSKPGEAKHVDEVYTLSIGMKVSLNDLKQLLKDNGLLHDSESLPIALPLVTWQDRIQGEDYRWWMGAVKPEQGFLAKESRLLETKLKENFERNGFFVMAPVAANLELQVPGDIRKEKIRGDDLQAFSQIFNSPLVLEGTVVLEKGTQKNLHIIDLKIAAIQVSNGRILADVSRKFEAEGSALETAIDKKLNEVLDSAAADLVVQIADVWQRGSIGTSSIKLTLRGRQVFKNLATFKSDVSSKFPQIKNIKERLISGESITYEVETSLSSAELLEKIASLDFSGKRLSKVSQSDSEVILKW